MSNLAIYGGEPIREDKIPITKPSFGEDEVKAASEVIRSCWVEGNGPKTEEFEQSLAKYLNAKYALFVNSCTSALHLALMSADIRDGALISSTYTFNSSAIVAKFRNLNISLADCEEDTGNLSLSSFEKNIRKNTKVVVPVHFAGQPCDMDEINKLAEDNDILVLEDAAHAIGSSYKNKKAGNLADIGCLSFHGTKNLVCGEGGALITNDDKIAEKARIFEEKGTKKYFFKKEKDKIGKTFEVVSEGLSYVQSDILAAIALEQLKKLDFMNDKRNKIAEFYNKNLKDVSNIKIPEIKDDRTTNWHLYTIKVPFDKRDNIIQALNAEGISANIHYMPLHLHPYYKNLGYKKGDFPKAEKFFESRIRLPMYSELSLQDAQDVVNAVKKVMDYYNN